MTASRITKISSKTRTEVSIPLLDFKRFSNSLELSSSGAEHEDLKEHVHKKIVKYFITVSYEDLSKFQKSSNDDNNGAPACIPDIFRTCPLGRKKSINR